MGDIILSGGSGGSSSGGDGAILDGADASIKATVLDLTDSNPVTVAIVDASGDQITSFGGGTQYVEDVASPADPTGTAIAGRRRNALASETTTDGDWTIVNTTAKGELYVKHVDAIPVTDNGGALTVDGTVTADQGAPASTANRWPVQITDGTDLALVTAAGEVNVLATAQPGVDIGDVTINNAAGAAAVNIQDGGNSITVDGTTRTEYVENTVLVSDPTGTALIGRARTVFGVAESGIAGGDSVIINATTAGELWVVDATSASVLAGISTILSDENAVEDAAMDADPTGIILSGRARSTPASEGVSDGDAVTLNATTKGELYVKHTDTIPVSVATGAGQTLLFAAISQGAAGTTTLVSADATKKIKVVSYVFVMSAAGTAKFIDSTPTDLTGAMAIATNGGVSAIGNSFSPLFATAVNKSLQIVTTVGAAAGHISYFLEA